MNEIRGEILKLEGLSKKIERSVLDPDLLSDIQGHLRYAYVIAAGSLIEQSFYNIVTMSFSGSGKNKCIQSFVKTTIKYSMFKYFDYDAKDESRAANKFYSSVGIKEEVTRLREGTSFRESEIAIVQLMKSRNETAHQYKIESFNNYTINDLIDKYRKSRLYLAYIAKLIRTKMR